MTRTTVPECQQCRGAGVTGAGARVGTPADCHGLDFHSNSPNRLPGHTANTGSDVRDLLGRRAAQLSPQATSQTRASPSPPSTGTHLPLPSLLPPSPRNGTPLPQHYPVSSIRTCLIPMSVEQHHRTHPTRNRKQSKRNDDEGGVDSVVQAPEDRTQPGLVRMSCSVDVASGTRGSTNADGTGASETLYIPRSPSLPQSRWV